MSAVPSPWRGRLLAFAGILLVALNLRAAVLALSPIAHRISVDVPLDAIVLGVIGAAPPLAFAAAGFFTPRLAGRLGVEQTLLVGVAFMAVGQIVRAVVPSAAVIVVGTVVALLGIGIGNVLMPPLVRRYFPDRIGGVTGSYVTVQTIGATVVPLVAVPLAVAAGWRFSLGSWAIIAVVAAVPWLVELARARGRGSREAVVIGASEAEPPLAAGMWRSPTAWAMAAGFTSTAAVAYVVFAAFPALLADVARVDDATAGALVAVFSLGGIPLAIVAPLLAARLRSSTGPALFSVVLTGTGFIGLLLAPAAAPWVWMACVSLGGAFFPYSLALVGVRSRTHRGSVALSGFMQAIGYIAGALGPLLVELLHAATGGWTASLIVMLVLLLPLVPAAIILSRPRLVEDELERSAARRGGS
jgi:MFS transporter, CP family, cyanate transporter